MLKRLRLKFVMLNMLMAAMVLTLAFSAICYFDYQQNVEKVRLALGLALDDGAAQSFGPGGFDGEGDLPDRRSDGGHPQIGRPSKGGDPQIPVAVYFVSADGSYVLMDDFASALVSDPVLSQAIEEACVSEQNGGYMSELGLFYERRIIPDGVIVAYADESAVSSWRVLAVTLFAVGIAALAVFLLVNLFFSRWALGPVRRAWDQQRQFVADASHELKTPLTVIMANLAILKSRPDSSIASQTQWIDSTQTEADRMQDLVCDMLELARPEDAKCVRDPFAEVDFSDVVEGAVLQFESVAFERGISLESVLDDGLLVQGDAKRLQRLLATLIDNACKYAGCGGSVSVRLFGLPRMARLEVRNTGDPIPKDDLPHVFDRFYRSDKARTSGEGGFGLGLAIAQEIAREHGGGISVTSSTQSGTVFVVTLPRDK